MMADQGITGVDAQSTFTAYFYAVPTGTAVLPLALYLANATTTFCYQWDVTGNITYQTHKQMFLYGPCP